jgi:hypothetical protein
MIKYSITCVRRVAVIVNILNLLRKTEEVLKTKKIRVLGKTRHF